MAVKGYANRRRRAQQERWFHTKEEMIEYVRMHRRNNFKFYEDLKYAPQSDQHEMNRFRDADHAMDRAFNRRGFWMPYILGLPDDDPRWNDIFAAPTVPTQRGRRQPGRPSYKDLCEHLEWEHARGHYNKETGDLVCFAKPHENRLHWHNN